MGWMDRREVYVRRADEGVRGRQRKVRDDKWMVGEMGV